MRHPVGVQFYLENGRQNEAVYKDIRMEISGDSYYWYKVDENLARIKYFVIHHSVTPAKYTPEQIARIHLNKGWDGIGYHFVITQDGTINYVGDLGTWRASVLNRNHEVVGVLLVGDFRGGRRPTDAQYRAANVLWREFLADSRFTGIKSVNALKFHRELSATACPCDVNKDFIANGLPKPIEAPYKVEPAPVIAPKPVTVLTPPIIVDTPKTIEPPVTEKQLEVYEKPSQEILDEQQASSFIAKLLKPIIAFIALVFSKLKK